MKRSKLALVAAALGALGVFDVVLGPLLIHAGVVSPIFGFQWLFGLGLLEGVLAGVVGLIALWRTRPAGQRSGRELAWVGVGCGALLLAVLVMAGRPGAGLPPINDITTDPADPPAFASDPAALDRDMTYPADFVEPATNAYSDLQPIRVTGDPAAALARVEETAKTLGWEVVTVDAEAGTLLARQTTAVFQFVDDVLVRVRPAGDGGSIVDVRSKSRDGRGDLGANAARIRSFTETLPR